MYALVNTMSATDNIIGRILSIHRSANAAEIECSKVQRQCKVFPGDTSYIPTRIVKLTERLSKLALIGKHQIDESYDRYGNADW